jgi:hypothetical protein
MIRHLHKLKKEKTNLKMNHPNWPNHIKNKTKILRKKQAKDFSLETKAIF